MTDLDPEILHKLIQAAFEGTFCLIYPNKADVTGRDQAYAPYSHFRVGAALLTRDGMMINGCNVENASYVGGAICAERTAVVKGVSSGHRDFVACVVASDVPSPSISPCGICRQVLREFLPLSAPIYMISSTYPYNSPTLPSYLGKDNVEERQMIVKMTLEELLPMSFGPDQLPQSG
ncbi:cytidine deaminase [Tremella mesenterica]|uniref:Cytidine deaminase n=1 Tax=Tremella mesenterica TaxID=5217 RepID=A0A4Q1BBM6_TREME|nr:cytidine deaminase [Tremella mesenterica]